MNDACTLLAKLRQKTGVFWENQPGRGWEESNFLRGLEGDRGPFTGIRSPFMGGGSGGGRGLGGPTLTPKFQL